MLKTMGQLAACKLIIIKTVGGHSRSNRQEQSTLTDAGGGIGAKMKQTWLIMIISECFHHFAGELLGTYLLRQNQAQNTEHMMVPARNPLSS
jgi:hypothetical protein